MAGTSQYVLWDYFDVWGNEEEGWTVNNQTVLYEGLSIEDDATETDLLKMLKGIGYLTTDDPTKIVVDFSDPDVIFISTAEGYPLCELRRDVEACIA